MERTLAEKKKESGCPATESDIFEGGDVHACLCVCACLK